jgi:ubiquitin C-terminal hydrolase
MLRETTMFGLNNYRGSCWVNACIQGLFRIPDLQRCFSLDENEENPNKNKSENALKKIYNSQGKDGLGDFFNTIDHKDLLAGRTIGDSHELLIYLLDKLPWLEERCKIHVADKIKCSNTECNYENIKEDTKIELSLFPHDNSKNIIQCIADQIKEEVLGDSKCEKCKEKLTKQLLFKELPKILIMHVFNNPRIRTDYSSSLTINNKKYILLSAICFNGGHWNCLGRNYSSDNNSSNVWYSLDDTNLTAFKENEFPVSTIMRVLIYYQE